MVSACPYSGFITEPGVLLLNRKLLVFQHKTILIDSHLGPKFTIVNSQLIVYTNNNCIISCIASETRYWLFNWHANILHSIIIPGSIYCCQIFVLSGAVKSSKLRDYLFIWKIAWIEKRKKRNLE